MRITKEKFDKYISRLEKIDNHSKKIIDKIKSSDIEVQTKFFEKYFSNDDLIGYHNFQNEYLYWSKERKLELEFIKNIIELTNKVDNKIDINKEKKRQETINKKLNTLHQLFYDLLYEKNIETRENILNTLLSILNKEKSEDIKEIILENIQNSYWIYYDEIINKQYHKLFTSQEMRELLEIE